MSFQREKNRFLVPISLRKERNSRLRGQDSVFYLVLNRDNAYSSSACNKVFQHSSLIFFGLIFLQNLLFQTGNSDNPNLHFSIQNYNSTKLPSIIGTRLKFSSCLLLQNAEKSSINSKTSKDERLNLKFHFFSCVESQNSRIKKSKYEKKLQATSVHLNDR